MRTCSTSSADVLKQTQIYTVEGEERDLQEYIFVELTGVECIDPISRIYTLKFIKLQ